MSWANGIDGESIENFKKMECHICKNPLGFYCLTDRYIGITPVCESCMVKEIEKKTTEDKLKPDIINFGWEKCILCSGKGLRPFKNIDEYVEHFERKHK